MSYYFVRFFQHMFPLVKLEEFYDFLSSLLPLVKIDEVAMKILMRIPKRRLRGVPDDRPPVSPPARHPSPTLPKPARKKETHVWPKECSVRGELASF